MGCNSSTIDVALSEDDRFIKLINIQDAERKYESEGIFVTNRTIDAIELRVLLDDGVAVKFLSSFASSNDTTYLLTMWISLQNFSKAKYDFQQCKAKLMVICMTCINNAHTIATQELFMSHKVTFENADVDEFLSDTSGMFRTLLVSCFESILQNIFVPFKTSSNYSQMNNAMSFSRNRVSVNDFDFIRKIGGGGFGIVFLCTRRSTGIQYAMKVQLKRSMLKSVKKSNLELPAMLDKLTIELRSMQIFEHPYIVSLSYAFQSPTMVFLLMSVSPCGDLEQSLKLCKSGHMDYERVRFYAAEIVSALCYLHSNGLIYRDLKPGNVLLNGDGHIMLTDFGSLADVEGKLSDPVAEYPNALSGSSSFVNTNNMEDGACSPKASGSYRLRSPVFSPVNSLVRREYDSIANIWVMPSGKPSYVDDEPCEGVASHKGTLPSTISNNVIYSKPSYGESDLMDVLYRQGSHSRSVNSIRKPAKSIVGTMSYMAPEILFRFADRTHLEGELIDEPYTEMVDSWSLGVFIFKLVTGVNPFKAISYSDLPHALSSALRRCKNNRPYVFRKLFCNNSLMQLDVLLEAPIKDLLHHLLQFYPNDRLKIWSEADGPPLKLKQYDNKLIRQITEHPFFDGIDWSKIESKTMPPPYIPKLEMDYQSKNLRNRSIDSYSASNTPRVSDNGGSNSGVCIYAFDEIMLRSDRAHWCDDSKDSKYFIASDDQSLFGDWQYISPAIIELENNAYLRK